MRKILFLLLLVSCTPDAVRYVIDGDTLVLNNGTTVRLAGIDAPEYGDWNYDRAGYELQRSVVGRQIRLEGNETDNYGRIVRYVFANGKNVNIELVQKGWARAAWHENSKYKALLEQAQEQAKQENKGIWNINDNAHKRLAHRCTELGCPLGTIAVGSKFGEVYYNCACSAAYIIEPQNLVCYKTLQEAITEGRREAKRC